MKKPVTPTESNTPAKKAPRQKSAAPTTASKKTVTPNKRPSSKKVRAKPADMDAITRMEALVVAALENLKANHIVTIDVHKLTDVMDTIIIASGTSSRHVKSLADNAMVELKKNGFRVYGHEGTDAGEWALVDFGSIVLHVMQPHIREFYDLERLWSVPPAPPPAAGE